MTDVARELRRNAFLQAMGLKQYVSRTQVSGAAPSKRLFLVNRPTQEPAVSPIPGVSAVLEKVQSAPAATAQPSVSSETRSDAVPIESFSVCAVQAGGWLWLEDIGDMPLAKEQVQLVVGMATALAGTVVKHAVAQFGWPMHQNQQLDQSKEAAAMSLGSFVERQLADGRCHGMVLMGESVSKRLPEQLECPERMQVPATRDMLENPALKRAAWSVLQRHARQ